MSQSENQSQYNCDNDYQSHRSTKQYPGFPRASMKVDMMITPVLHHVLLAEWNDLLSLQWNDLLFSVWWWWYILLIHLMHILMWNNFQRGIHYDIYIYQSVSKKEK